MTYFNNVSKFHNVQEYDLYFAYTKTFPLWDERKGRDNRCYLPDIRENIFHQVSNRTTLNKFRMGLFYGLYAQYTEKSVYELEIKITCVIWHNCFFTWEF